VPAVGFVDAGRLLGGQLFDLSIIQIDALPSLAGTTKEVLRLRSVALRLASRGI